MFGKLAPAERHRRVFILEIPLDEPLVFVFDQGENVCGHAPT